MNLFLFQANTRLAFQLFLKDQTQSMVSKGFATWWNRLRAMIRKTPESVITVLWAKDSEPRHAILRCYCIAKHWSLIEQGLTRLSQCSARQKPSWDVLIGLLQPMLLKMPMFLVQGRFLHVRSYIDQAHWFRHISPEFGRPRLRVACSGIRSSGIHAHGWGICRSL